MGYEEGDCLNAEAKNGVGGKGGGLLHIPIISQLLYVPKSFRKNVT